MQRKRKYSNAHGLAMLFGQRLLHVLDTNVHGLNRNLPFPTNGQPFVLGKNPSGHVGFAPPRVFNSLLDEGTWPDTSAFIEPADLTKSTNYNLYRRVCAHLPPVTPWLFSDLRDVAHQKAIDLRAVQHAIDRHARAFGLSRMHHLVGDAILSHALHANQNPMRMFEPIAGRLAEAKDAAGTTFLSLMWLEAHAWSGRPRDTFTEVWAGYARRGWTELMRQPWLRRHPNHFREILRAVRGMLEDAPHLKCIHPLPTPKSQVETATPLSLLWSPTREERAAHDRLVQWRWESLGTAMEQVKRHRFAKPATAPAPEQVLGDFELVLRAGLASGERLPKEPSWRLLLPPEVEQRTRAGGAKKGLEHAV